MELVNTRTTLSLAHRDAEIALRMRRPPASGDIAVRRIGRVGVALYASDAHVRDRGVEPPLGLERLAFIGLRADARSRQSAWLDRVAAGVPMPLRLRESVRSL